MYFIFPPHLSCATAEPLFTVKTIDGMHQTGPRILLSISHMLYVNLVCHGVGHCVKDGSCSSSSLSESQGHYIFILLFLVSSSFFLLFFPRLNSAFADWMFTILHMVWPYCEFQMQVWNVLHATHWKYSTQKVTKKSPSGHHRTNLSGYIFATKACIDNRGKTC